MARIRNELPGSGAHAAGLAKATMTQMSAAHDSPAQTNLSAVDGEISVAVRVIDLAIAGLVTVAIVAGIWKGFTTAGTGRAALVDDLMLTEVALAAVLFLLGSIVEVFG